LLATSPIPLSSSLLLLIVDADAHKLSLLHYFWEEFALEERELGGVYLHEQPPLPAGFKGEFLLKRVVPQSAQKEAIYGTFHLMEVQWVNNGGRERGTTLYSD
tara:strand:- start:152 stop:460 length:309 start_codon:yes stop_codon:yes gene_type:complete